MAVKYYPKRRRVRRRRLSRIRRRRAPRTRIQRQIVARRSANFYNYGRWENMNTIQINSAIWYQGNSFRLNDLLDIGQISTMYDQYKIKSIVVRFRLTTNPEGYLIPNSTTTNQNTLYPDIYITVDHDDASTPTSINQIQEYGKSKQGVLRADKWFTYKFHPRFAVPTYLNGVTYGYTALNVSTWADCAYPDVPHYGLKFAIDTRYGSTPNQNITVQWQAFFHVLFKDSR